MRDVVFSAPALLPVLSRFGISLGFGEATVADVCRQHHVDTSTFLAVCNFVTEHPYETLPVNISTLVGYLRSAHIYFLDYVLPGIRKKLIEAISTGMPSDLTLLIIKFYDEFVDEVRRHMSYEDDTVFVYVSGLVEGHRDASYAINTFRDSHTPIAGKIRDLKELFVAHYTAENARVDMLNSVLFDIITCERELVLHCAFEDRVFVPAVRELEHHVEQSEIMADADNDGEEPVGDSTLDEHGDVVLTPRERDIVTAIARGLSNKETADKLFLSVHTVTTHRRNICAKLNIHSTSGITIYAIMHGLISLEEGRELIR